MTLRRYAVLVAIMAVILSVAAFRLGQATTTLTFDAAWWQGLTQSQRLATVQGIIDGYQSGYFRGHEDGVLTTSEQDSAFEGAMLETYFTGERVKYLRDYRNFRVASISNGLWMKTYAKAHKTGEELATKHGLISGKPTFPNTFGTYIDEITHFYENNPTKADWSAGKIMDCLSSFPSKWCGT